MHLGAHLADNLTLEHLDLRLNRCEDNGVSHLFHDLCVNKSPCAVVSAVVGRQTFLCHVFSTVPGLS